MDQIKEEDPQNLKVKEFKDVNLKDDANNSKDNTPVRYSDHIIDDEKIEIDISGGENQFK